MAALEGLLGFALVTASVSWIVLIYPALGRMRSLARSTSTLVKAQELTGIPIISAQADGLLSDLARDVIRTRVDFIHFPLIYYFHADTERASLPDSLRHLTRFAELGSSSTAPSACALLQQRSGSRSTTWPKFWQLNSFAWIRVTQKGCSMRSPGIMWPANGTAN